MHHQIMCRLSTVLLYHQENLESPDFRMIDEPYLRLID